MLRTGAILLSLWAAIYLVVSLGMAVLEARAREDQRMK